MALLDVIHYPHPTLLKRSEEIDVFDVDLQKLVENMHETMLHENGIGLAAPQVNLLKRLMVVQIPEEDSEGEFYAFCNPTIVEKHGHAKIEEGCLSLPEFLVEVDRAERIVVEAQNATGETFQLEAEGLLSICIQHEMDHLDGKLLVNYVSDIKRDQYKRKMLKKA